jgi:membrane protease YdiL (CAAX protease family)
MIYMAVILLGGALLAPWLYWFVQWAAEHFSGMAHLAQQPFHRFLNRSMLALAFAGVLPFLRSVGVNSWSAVGLVRPRGQWKGLALGFAVAFGSLACVALLAIATDGRRLQAGLSPGAFLSRFCGAALTAAVVALLEEVLFRGALFGALRKTYHWIVALVVSSMIYALVHFFRRVPSPPDITWASGFQLLPQMLSGFVEVQTLMPGFITLTVAGMILALAYHRSGTLYLSIGLHAGWIFWLKFYGFVTTSRGGANTWLWGSAKLIDGWMALIVLASVFMFMAVSQKKLGASHAG